MNLKKIVAPLPDGRHNASMAACNGTVYLSGLTAPGETVQEQVSAIFAYCEKLFAENGWRREDILMITAFLSDLSQADGYEEIWQPRLSRENPPTSIRLGALLPEGRLAEISLLLADRPYFEKEGKEMNIQRIDHRDTSCSRFVIHNGLAYFTDHVARTGTTLEEQSKALFARFDELFGIYGLKRENMVFCYTYLADMAEQPLYDRLFGEWVGENPPAGICLESKMNEGYRLAVSVTVALDEDWKGEAQ